MDFQQLISFAEKRNYAANSDKKSSANGRPDSSSKPNPNAVAKFLQKKKEAEMQRAIEERRRKERLIALRNQNSKSAKAAKMMMCKTKDNDFSKIVLSEREIEDKNYIERELRRKRLDDPVERMKERIEKERELEEASKGKRRRKPLTSSDKEVHSIKNKDRFDYKEVQKQTLVSFFHLLNVFSSKLIFCSFFFYAEWNP